MKCPCFLIAALCLALAAPAAAGDVDQLDSENGFRDARFGMGMEAMPGLELLTENGAAGTRLYVRPGDELALGDARLDGVTYGFYEDQLYFVAMFISGRRNTQAVLAAFEAAYGEGLSIAGDAVEYVWHGKRVALHFREDPATGVGMAALTSLALDAQLKSASAPVPADAAP